ncbi:hypothetical protein L209DRAFT_166983 [Thermothelomyces heterothallicus CBS 203.75]
MSAHPRLYTTPDTCGRRETPILMMMMMMMLPVSRQFLGIFCFLGDGIFFAHTEVPRGQNKTLKELFLSQVLSPHFFGWTTWLLQPASFIPSTCQLAEGTLHPDSALLVADPATASHLFTRSGGAHLSPRHTPTKSPRFCARPPTRQLRPRQRTRLALQPWRNPAILGMPCRAIFSVANRSTSLKLAL